MKKRIIAGLIFAGLAHAAVADTLGISFLGASIDSGLAEVSLPVMLGFLGIGLATLGLARRRKA